jgi:Uma2 family endonuclease
MALVQRRLSLEEFLALPEEEPALEYVEGLVTQKMSPKQRHGRLQGAICTHFNLFAEPRKLGLAFPELRVTFAGASFVPDVSFFRWERLVLTAGGELADDVFIAPDIAVEILSPGQSVASQEQRCRLYVANGVQVALFVNPDARGVRSFRPGAPPVESRENDVIDLDDVLPGFRLTAAELFASLRPGR